MALSMRLTKKLATPRTFEMSPPLANSASRPAMCASATARYASMPNNRVTLTLIPSPISWRMAGTPGCVPGTLIITLGRFTASQSRRASTMVASVSMAR